MWPPIGREYTHREAGAKHAVVRLGHGCEPVPFQTFDDPQLPQGLLSVQRPRQNVRSDSLELLLVPRPWQGDVTHVVVEAEAVVVDPHGLTLDRDVRESLPVSRHQMQLRGDVLLDALDINPGHHLLLRDAFPNLPAFVSAQRALWSIPASSSFARRTPNLVLHVVEPAAVQGVAYFAAWLFTADDQVRSRMITIGAAHQRATLLLL